MATNDTYWEVKRYGIRVAYGPESTMPTESQRKALRRDGHKIYVGGKIFKN